MAADAAIDPAISEPSGGRVFARALKNATSDLKGIGLYKIRSVRRDLFRTVWVLDEAAKHGIKVGVARGVVTGVEICITKTGAFRSCT